MWMFRSVGLTQQLFFTGTPYSIQNTAYTQGLNWVTTRCYDILFYPSIITFLCQLLLQHRRSQRCPVLAEFTIELNSLLSTTLPNREKKSKFELWNRSSKLLYLNASWNHFTPFLSACTITWFNTVHSGMCTFKFAILSTQSSPQFLLPG